MANWTLYTSVVSGGDITQAHVVVLGNSLYFLDTANPGNVVQYNKDTDSVQTVLDAATVGITAAVSVANFKGVLYASAYTTGVSTTEVWVYGGTPNAWTQVLAKNNTAFNSADLMCNSEFMVVIEKAYVGGVWVTSNGSSWSAASTVPVNNYIDGLGNEPKWASQWDLTFFADYQSGDPAADNRTSQLTGANTVAVISDYAIHLASVQNNDYLWFQNFSSGDYEYSTDAATFTASPEGGDVYPVAAQNMPYSIGGDTVGGTVYYFIGSAWVDQGDLPVSGVSKAFRFSDGTVMVIGGDGGLYVSDEPIPDPVTANARFYFAPAGQSLAEKFTLPFPRVHPGGMTLDRTLGTVVIGSDAPSSEPVIYSTYPYATGTATYDGFPTGTAIQSLKWI